MDHLGRYLVEIRVKAWVAGDERVLAYEEVDAYSEVGARYAGFDQFEKRLKADPVLFQRFKDRVSGIDDLCAPDAVRLEEA